MTDHRKEAMAWLDRADRAPNVEMAKVHAILDLAQAIRQASGIKEVLE